MSRAVLTAVLGVATCVAAFDSSFARAGTIQVLPIFNEAIEVLPFFGQAWGVDGKNVVGMTASQVGFLYDGETFTPIQPPGGFTTAALGIDGSNIVGFSGSRGFLYDGSTYTMLTAPLGAKGTIASGISGTSIVGWYNDANNVSHGFLYDGTTWTTLDHPLGALGTQINGIDGNNIVGTYITAPPLIRTRGFLYDGTTWTTLNDTFITPTLIGDGTTAHDISGDNIVGVVRGGSFSAPFIYDGSTFTHPSVGLPGAVFTGISGNTIVGYFHDGPTGLNRPFIYTIAEPVPEPASLTLAAIGGAIVLAVARRARRGRSPSARGATLRDPGG